MLKKLLWLGFFGLVAIGVWKGAPWIAQKYRAWQEKRTQELYQKVKKSAEGLTAPTNRKIKNRAQKVRERLKEIEQNQ